jgi:hypothetical protein
VAGFASRQMQWRLREDHAATTEEIMIRPNRIMI